MRKFLAIIISFASFLFISTLRTNAAAESESNPSINDNTTIQEDLTIMGLNYQDYLITGTNYDKLVDFYNAEGYSEQFVIAVGENYTQSPGKIVSYIYCYNPLMYYGDINIILSISLNDVFYKTLHYNTAYTDMQIAKEDKTAGIVCFKLELFKATDLARKYSIDINDPGMDSFECTYVTETNGNKKCNYFNYDSVVYITKDKVVSCVFKNCKDIPAGILSSFFTALLKGDPDLNTVAYFYNFSSNKKIEKILSANMSWTENMHESGWVTKQYGTYLQTVEIPTKNERTKKNVEIGIKDRTTIKLWDNEITIDPFAVPASDRLNQLPSDYVKEMTSQQKELFTGYEYSILFASGIYKDIYSTDLITGKPCFPYKHMLLVEDVRLTKLVYETDGVLYNSIVVDNDGGDQGFTPGKKPDIESPKPDYNSFQKFLLWFGKKTVDFFSPTTKWPDWGYMTVGGVELGLLGIIAITLLPHIISLILLPFKIIKRISR